MDESINIKLDRDQARAVREQFMPYMKMLCETRLTDARPNVDDYLNCMVIRSLFLDLVEIFDKKLDTVARQFTFKFSAAAAITFYKLLMILPINSCEVWLINLRNHLTNFIHREILEP